MAPSTAELFCYLLLTCRNAQTRQAIAFAVWPDDSEGEASAKLRRHLYNIRKALPSAAGPWFCVTETTVQWNNTCGVSIDVERFDRFAESPEAAAAACELYAGDVLPKLEAEWLTPVRQHYHDTFMTLAGNLIAAAEAERDFGAILRIANQVLRVDPYREDMLRKVMLARFRAGDRAGALLEYERFESLIARELAAQPMAQTKALRNSIALAGEEADQPRAPAWPSRDEPPFVGRSSELAQLRGLLDDSLRGRRNTAIVRGESGIGKSRLVEEFCAQSAERAASATGFCRPDGALYQPLADIFATWAAELRRTGINQRWLHVLGSFVPELREFTGQEAAPHGHGAFFEALAEALAALSSLRPLVLVIEDLHLASFATLETLTHLRMRLGDLPVTFLLTYRHDEEIRGNLAQFLKSAEKSGALVVDVPKLDVTAVTALFERTEPRLADLAKGVFDVTAGNALFVVQMLRQCIETGAMPESMGGSVSAAIDRRLERLGDDALVLAEGASVIGDSFDIELLRDVTRWERSKLFDALSELLDQHIIHERKKAQGLQYAFSHQLVRSRLYDRLSPDARLGRHSRIARVLEADGGAFTLLAVEIARHFEAAGEARRSSVYYLHAARRALDFGAVGEALDLATSGLSLCSDQHTMFELLLVRERALGRAGDSAAQSEALKQLVSIALDAARDDWSAEVAFREIAFCRATGAKAREFEIISSVLENASGRRDYTEAEALRQRAAFEISRGELDTAATTIAQAAEIFHLIDQPDKEIECTCMLADVASYRSAPEDLDALYGLANRLEGGPRHRVQRVYETLSRALHGMRRWDHARDVTQRLLEICIEMGDRTGEVKARQMLVGIAAETNDFEDAFGHSEAALAISRLTGNIEAQAFVLHNAAMLYHQSGQLEQSTEQFLEARELFERVANRRGSAYCDFNIGSNMLDSLRFTDCLRYSDKAACAALALNVPLVAGCALRDKSWALSMLGDASAALESARHAVALLRPIEAAAPDRLMNALAALAFASAHDGDGVSATATVCEIERRLQTDAGFGGRMSAWHAALTLRMLGQECRAGEMLLVAYEKLRQEAATLPENVRESFLAIPASVQIIDAFERRTWPAAAHSLSAKASA